MRELALDLEEMADSLRGLFHDGRQIPIGRSHYVLNVPAADGLIMLHEIPQTIFLVSTSTRSTRSEMRSEWSRRRSRRLDTSEATAGELRASWGPLLANAGTYKIVGERITIHPLVAEIPLGDEAGCQLGGPAAGRDSQAGRRGRKCAPILCQVSE